MVADAAEWAKRSKHNILVLTCRQSVKAARIYPIPHQRRAVERRERLDYLRRRIVYLCRQEHVLEVCGRVIGIRTAGRVAVLRGIRLQGDKSCCIGSIQLAAGSIVSKPRPAEWNAVDGNAEGGANCGLTCAVEGQHLPVGRVGRVHADNPRTLPVEGAVGSVTVITHPVRIAGFVGAGLTVNSSNWPPHTVLLTIVIVPVAVLFP